VHASAATACCSMPHRLNSNTPERAAAWLCERRRRKSFSASRGLWAGPMSWQMLRQTKDFRA